MIDLDYYETAVANRLNELGIRKHGIEAELGNAKSSDLEQQAIDLEDDDVLDGLGLAAQKEAALLKQALGRIKNKTYGD